MIGLVFIWIAIGIIAELIGVLYYKEFNGYKSAAIIVLMGLLSLLSIIGDILDEGNNTNYS